jgi:hypothetical protein
MPFSDPHINVLRFYFRLMRPKIWPSGNSEQKARNLTIRYTDKVDHVDVLCILVDEVAPRIHLVNITGSCPSLLFRLRAQLGSHHLHVAY